MTREFLDGSVVRTLSFHAKGLGSVPRWDLNSYKWHSQLKQIKERINNLEKSKLDLVEMNRFVATIQNEKEYIEKEARPNFIRYCKTYTDIKKAHAKEIRNAGHISYNKAED